MPDFLDPRTLDFVHYYVDPSQSYTGKTLEIMGITVTAARHNYYGDEKVKILSRFAPGAKITETTWVWSVRWLAKGKDSIGFYGDFELFKNDIVALKMATIP